MPFPRRAAFAPFFGPGGNAAARGYIDVALTNAYKDQIDEWITEYADERVVVESS